MTRQPKFIAHDQQRIAMHDYFRSLRDMRVPSAELAMERRSQFFVECSKLMRDNGVDKPEFGEASLQRLPRHFPAQYLELAGILLGLMFQSAQLAIVGPRGTGKTWLACGLVNAFCETNRRAVYHRTRDYFADLSAKEWAKKDFVRQAYLAPELLVLDEVQERDGDRQWQDSELTDLIDRRWSRHRSTVLLGNFEPNALMSNLGASIQRRIVESGGVWPANWKRVMEFIRA